MPQFADPLEGDEIYFRDRWQFEQKSDFLPDPDLPVNEYTEEIYFFIPNSLQIHPTTYTPDQFYRDETNMIRYKTPVFTLEEINDLVAKGEAGNHEMKLLGNIVRSAVRTTCQRLSALLEGKKYSAVDREGKELIEELTKFQAQSQKLEKGMVDKETYGYVHSFIVQSTKQYLLMFLERLRSEREPQLAELDKKFTAFIEKLNRSIPLEEIPEKEGEAIIYQKTLLNKYVIDALLLDINRFSPTQKYRNLIASLAAGLAMLFFFILFTKQGDWFILNSTPFILFTVVLYVIKDRIKDWIRDVANHQRLGWLSDFTTKIKSPDGMYVLGVLKEKFSYLDLADIPPDIAQVRNRDFHTYLETFKRPETVLYYKKNIKIYKKPESIDPRRFLFNVIFRFNIRHFLDKASEPYTTLLTLDPETQEILSKRLAKVYHINMLIKTKGHLPTDIRKVRLIADKNGIKRVEYL